MPWRRTAPRSTRLLPAFDAVKRLSTHYANVDFPDGSYDQERIRFMKGSLRLRVNLPRPKTRYDRIMSLPVVLKEVQTDQFDLQASGKRMVVDSILAGLTGGLSMLFTGAPGTNVQYKTAMVETKAQIFDAFMSMDANFQHVPPSQCIRVKRFVPQTLSFTVPWMTTPITIQVSGEDFFGEGLLDRQQWELYARLLGYQDDGAGKGVYKLLDYYFKDRLISEWDAIFNNDIAPLIFDKLVEGLRLQEFALDLTATGRYTGGERVMAVNLTGRTSRTRADLPEVIRLTEANATMASSSRSSPPSSTTCGSTTRPSTSTAPCTPARWATTCSTASTSTSRSRPRRSATRVARTGTWPRRWSST